MSMFFKKYRAKFRDFCSQEDVKKKIDEIEFALKAATINKPQSEIDLNKSTAVSSLIQSIDGIDCAAIRIEDIILIKVNRNDKKTIVALTLTENDYIVLKNHPELLYMPEKLLEALNQKGLRNDTT